MAAREGIGFAFMPHWLVADDIAKSLLEQVLPGTPWPKVPLHAMYLDKRYLTHKVRDARA
ncbi:MAG: LysR substrate-binding domain-containing protein [Rhizobiaceae bacterium]|nr:LysR substrate-binding domain-containing protein [Rhizobiaceae bacterium]